MTPSQIFSIILVASLIVALLIFWLEGLDGTKKKVAKLNYTATIDHNKFVSFIYGTCLMGIISGFIGVLLL